MRNMKNIKLGGKMRIDKDKELKKILKIVSPGTHLREGLENILRAKTGGLIVLGDSDDVMSIVDGGFKIDSVYTPAYIYELAKMDGAIILSSDLKRILYANTQLQPSVNMGTFETGTRHRTAQRVAKQTEKITIAISQRRNMITLYKGDVRYILKDTNEVISRANQAIQTLEKYVAVLEKVVNNLNVLEFQDLVSMFDVATAIQRTEMVMRIVEEIEIYIVELGNEGRLISMQLDELIKDIEDDGIMMIKDYCKDGIDYESAYREVQKLDYKELLEIEYIAKELGYSGDALVDTLVSSRGNRILNKIPRIPSNVIDNMIKHFKYISNVLNASTEDLDQVEGIGEARAKAIKSSIKRLKEQVSINKRI